jgi:hypothetical protein
MKITIEATPKEVAELLQVVGSDLEQKLIQIIHDPTNAFNKEMTDAVNRENNRYVRSIVTDFSAMFPFLGNLN